MLTETDPINGTARVHEVEFHVDPKGRRVARRIIEGGQCQELHGHDHNEDHVVVVAEGEILLWVCEPGSRDTSGLAPKRMKKGDRLLVKANNWHTYKGISESWEVHCDFLVFDDNGKVVTTRREVHAGSSRSWV